MDCATLVKYLSDYIDNNLSDDLVLAAREHLATCKNCRVVLDSTQRTILLFQNQPQAGIPDKRRHALYATLESAFAKKA